MGEPVAEKWTEEEENLFHEVIFSNPSSMGRKFWNGLSHAFPSRTKAEIVSYYFNVFMLRKRAEQNRFDPMNVDSDNDEWQANEEEDEDSIVESPIYQLHPLERSQDHSDEFGDNNLVDETCVEDEYTSPLSSHIRRIDDSQADGDFEWRDKSWDERSYHGTQDDSCMSFDNGATGQGLQVKYNDSVCDGDVPDVVLASRLRNKDDLMPTFSVIKEVFMDELSDCQCGGEKGAG
ncbi:hypothetical protein MLD38_031894 [Melastoma candidum]|nr:hypothetical protein MLD38_031894 [Melastoma candidum]